MRQPRHRPLVAAIVLLVVGTLVPAAVSPALAVRPPDVAQRYVIAATLDPDAGALDARMTLELTNTGVSRVDHVVLAAVPRGLGFFALTDDVTVDGEPVEPEWTTSIAMRLPVSLAPEATGRIEVPFRLDVGRPPDAFTARLSRENGVLSFGHWFPILSTEHEIYGLGDPQISFTADAIRLELDTTRPLPRDAIACPGLVSAPEPTGTTWVCDVEQVRDFSFVVNPRFELTQRTVDGVDVRAYAETVAGARTVDLAADALIGLSDAFGPYPWPDLVLAEVGSGGGFSMEYPRMIHLTREKVVDPYVVYHEVAHQWFYGQLGNDQQTEPWVDEAWADFSARYLMNIGENACATRPVDASVFAWDAGPTSGGDWTSCDGYFHAVFYQGTQFITAVRAAMGDEDFFAAMRSWVDEHRHGFVTGDDLLLHLLRRSDADLMPIYRRYLDDPDPRPYRALATRNSPYGPTLR